MRTHAPFTNFFTWLRTLTASLLAVALFEINAGPRTIAAANTPGSTQSILIEFVSCPGASPYFQINTGYPDASGAPPNGGLIYAGSVNDVYSHGPSLSVIDIQNMIAQQITSHNLPLDTTRGSTVMASRMRPR